MRYLAALALLSLSFVAGATSTVEGKWLMTLVRGTSSTQLPHSEGATEAEAKTACLARIPSSEPVTSQQTGTNLFTCRDLRYTAVRTYSPNAPVTCPAAPAPQVEQRACPAGTVGTWMQTGTTTIGPAPGCTATLTWAPGSPRTTDCPPPPPVNCVVSAWGACQLSEWSACTEGSQTQRETCTRTVVTQPANGGSACPALVETRISSRPCSMAGTALLSWTPAPASRCENGTTASGCTVSAYRIVYGRSATELVQSIQIPATASSYTMTGLAAGAWHFAVIAVASRDSVLSNIAARTVQ